VGAEQVKYHDSDGDRENGRNEAIVVPRLPITAESLLASLYVVMRGEGLVRPPAEHGPHGEEYQHKPIIKRPHRPSSPPARDAATALASIHPDLPARRIFDQQITAVFGKDFNLQ
jgi:hypothetical protein